MKQLNLKPVFKFLGFTLLLYSVFIFLGYFCGIGKGFSSAFNSLGSAAFSNYGENGEIRFSVNEKDEDEVKLIMLNKVQLENAKAEKRKNRNAQINIPSGEMSFKPWLFGFMSLALLISLILASPIPVKRKLIALVLGIGIYLLFLLLKMDVYIWEHLNGIHYDSQNQAKLNVAVVSQYWYGALINVKSIFASTSFNMISIVFIWLLVSFRKKDIVAFKKMIS